MLALSVAMLAIVMAEAAQVADYVVVGGGTAGCALAARLCEGLPQSKIVLLERGKPRTEAQELKVRAIRYTYETWGDPEISEQWESEPNPGLLGRRVDILAGRTLGGSSAINAAQWTIPVPSIPLSWGVNGLDAATVSRLYARVEATLQPQQAPETLWQTYLEPYLAANERAGVELIQDPQGDVQDTVWVSYQAVDGKGRRRDSCEAYLTPALGPSGACAANLGLVQGATVAAVVFNGSRAAGIEYSVGGPGSPMLRLDARREVLLTAGPYGSAKLLQLSGIGPASVLAAHGIPLVSDLPVGVDAQARPAVILLHKHLLKPIAPENVPSNYFGEAAKAQFRMDAGGVLAVSVTATNGVLAPPVDAYTTGTNVVPREVLGLTDFLRLYLSACILNSDSRATLQIASADPFASPKVATNLLSAPADVERAKACIARQRQVMAQWPFSYGMTEILPGGVGTLLPPTAAQARAIAQNGYHFVGACKVGGVLDGDLKVIGFENLRVVDSSAIPYLPANSGPASSVYMLAELIAERIISETGA